MKVLHVEGELVLPYERKDEGFGFATLHTHEPRGPYAVVVDEPEASPRSIARAELGITPDSIVEPRDLELAEHLAAHVLGELAWLHEVPVGARVRLNTRGRMRLHVGPEKLDYHRAEARDWARKQRRDGYLPILVIVGERVRTLALPWRGSRVVVDLDEVRRVLPQYGVASAAYVEVL